MNLRDRSANLFARWTASGGYKLTEALFLRLLGLIYISAFGSLWPQIAGLAGTRGINPASQLLAAVHAELGSKAYFDLPTLFWWGISDGGLKWVCGLGCLGGLLMLGGIATRAAAGACWILYLSLIAVAQPFTGFQWDALLLEAGFLALFAGGPWLVWGYRVLLFRLMFESGAVKLLSHDANWPNLHALRYHFLTQPLPNPFAYYMYRAPTWLLDGLTAATLAIELFAPFLLFGPRIFGKIGVGLLMALQVAIMLTGNYAFFNLLTLALCLWGLDDRTFRPLQGILMRRWPQWMLGSAGTVLRGTANAAIALLIVLGTLQMAGMFSAGWTAPVRKPLSWIGPFELVNTYGLFAVMTTERPEIVLEGSNDQTTWREYSFKYKPGELHRDLPMAAPHQPRLDWQMWFAALGSVQENEWVGHLMYRLMVGEPSVIGLMNRPPFEKPPRYMRALLYDYKFTPPSERSRTGAVWSRELRGTWFGPVSLTGR